MQLLAEECDIGNPEEIVRLIGSTFGEDSQQDDDDRTIMPTNG